jgi:hypothetical protein
MLEQVVIQSSSPTTLNVSDVDPDEILLIKSITGLSPKGLTLFTGEFARDGGYYQGRRAGKRNPVFTFKLNPNYAEDIEVSDIRELLYKMFLEPNVDSDAVQVTLIDDRKPDRYFIGYTEDIDTDMWSLEQTAMVSLICTDPYLRSVEETSDSDEAGWLSVPLTYDGSADTGFFVELKVATANTQITLDLNGETMVLTGSFAVDDVITINTLEGSRYIRKNGVDIMGSLSAASRWLQLSAVANTLQTYSTVVGDAKVKVMSYAYRSAWWGI